MGTIRIARHTTVTGDFDGDGQADDSMDVVTYVEVDTGDDDVADRAEIEEALKNDEAISREIRIDIDRNGTIAKKGAKRGFIR
jgi:hypothetical protein